MVNASRVLLPSCFREDQDLSQVFKLWGFWLIELKHSKSEWDFIANHSKRKNKNQRAIIPLLMIKGWLKSAIYSFHSKLSSGRNVRTLMCLQSFMFCLSHTLLKSSFSFRNICGTSKIILRAPRTSSALLMRIELVRIFCFILKLRWKVNWAEGACSVYSDSLY